MNINECRAELEFIGSSIKKLSISNDFINFPDEEDAERLYDVEYMLHDISESETELAGYVNLFVDVVLKHGDKQSKINLVIEGCFSMKKNNGDNEKEVFEKILSVNGCALLYSVARAVLLTTTSHVYNKGSVKLPMVNFYKIRNAKENEN